MPSLGEPIAIKQVLIRIQAAAPIFLIEYPNNIKDSIRESKQRLASTSIRTLANQ